MATKKGVQVKQKDLFKHMGIKAEDYPPKVEETEPDSECMAVFEFLDSLYEAGEIDESELDEHMRRGMN